MELKRIYDKEGCGNREDFETTSINVEGTSTLKDCLMEILDIDQEYVDEEHDGSIYDMFWGEFDLLDEEDCLDLVLDDRTIIHLGTIIGLEDDDFNFELTINEIIEKYK